MTALFLAAALTMPSARMAFGQASDSGTPALELVFPAPGCPDKLPTYRSLEVACEPLDAQACGSKPACFWLKTTHSHCLPHPGAYVPPPDMEPAEAARLGIPDTIELPVLPTLSFEGRNLVETGPPIDIKNGLVEERRGELATAIVEYSKALDKQPNLPEALSDRARAYELKGDKAAAVRDYCRILVAISFRERRTIAKERIVDLTGQPNPVGAQDMTIIARLRPATPPPTGTIESKRTGGLTAPLKIETERGTSYFIKLVPVGSEKETALIFVNGGDEYSGTVPLGTYRIRLAAGLIWFGRKDLFGPRTRFFVLQDIAGAQQTFSFIRQGGATLGMTFTLKNIAGGNIEQKGIKREEF